MKRLVPLVLAAPLLLGNAFQALAQPHAQEGAVAFDALSIAKLAPEGARHFARMAVNTKGRNVALFYRSDEEILRDPAQPILFERTQTELEEEAALIARDAEVPLSPEARAAHLRYLSAIIGLFPKADRH